METLTNQEVIAERAKIKAEKALYAYFMDTDNTHDIQTVQSDDFITQDRIIECIRDLYHLAESKKMMVNFIASSAKHAFDCGEPHA